MPDTIPTAIAEIIQQESARLQKEQVEQAIRLNKQAQAEALKLRKAWAALKEQVLALVPEEIRPYAVFGDDDGTHYIEYRMRVLFEIPGIAPMIMLIQNCGGDRTPEPDGFSAFVYPEVHQNYDGPEYDYRNGHTDSVPFALAACARAFREMAEAKALETVLQSEEDAREQAKQAHANAMVAEREDEQCREDEEAHALLAALQNDQVAAHMLKAFAALQAERRAVQEQVDGLSDSLDSVRDDYGARLDRASEQARAAQHEASEAARRAADVEYTAGEDIKQLKRQIA